MATFKCWLVEEPIGSAETVEHKTPLEAAQSFAQLHMSGEDWEDYGNRPDVAVEGEGVELQVFEVRRLFDYVTRENPAALRKLLDEREFDAAEAAEFAEAEG